MVSMFYFCSWTRFSSDAESKPEQWVDRHRIGKTQHWNNLNPLQWREKSFVCNVTYCTRRRGDVRNKKRRICLLAQSSFTGAHIFFDVFSKLRPWHATVITKNGYWKDTRFQCAVVERILKESLCKHGGQCRGSFYLNAQTKGALLCTLQLWYFVPCGCTVKNWNTTWWSKGIRSKLKPVSCLPAHD